MCKEVLVLAEDLQLDHIMVASDYLQAIKDADRPFDGSYSMVLQEIKANARSF